MFTNSYFHKIAFYLVNMLSLEIRGRGCRLPTNKVKININDEEGNKITISFEGKITRNKVLQVLDFVELLGGGSTSNEERNISDFSKFEKIRNVIERKLPIGSFTSQEVMMVYEDLLNEPIGLSTVSTYLSRLVDKGVLARSGSAAGRKYKLRRSQTPREEQHIQQ